MSSNRGSKFEAQWLCNEETNEIISRASASNIMGGSKIQIVQ